MRYNDVSDKENEGLQEKNNIHYLGKEGYRKKMKAFRYRRYRDTDTGFSSVEIIKTREIN